MIFANTVEGGRVRSAARCVLWAAAFLLFCGTLLGAEPVYTVARADFGRSGQDVQTNYKPWSGTTSVDFVAFGGFKASILALDGSSSVDWCSPHSVTGALGSLIEDGVDSTKGLRLTFTGLRAGAYKLRTYHHNSSDTRTHTINIYATDASGTHRPVATNAKIGYGCNYPAVSSALFTIQSNGQPVKVEFERADAFQVWLNGFDLEPVPVANNLQITPTGTDSSAHVVDQYPATAGTQTLLLPSLIRNLVVAADGTRLPIQIVADPTRTETVARVTVPTGARTLKVEYDRTDAALAYEGSWYLDLPAVTGPKQVVIQLPTGAVVDRLKAVDSDPSPTRIQVDLVAGQTLQSPVVYRTPLTPQLYEFIPTDHLTVGLPFAHAPYRESVLGYLENVYALFGKYSLQDVNRIQSQRSYPFTYAPGGWMWGQYELGGGLSVKGLSMVNGRLTPLISLSTDQSPNIMVAISAHELANGWWGLHGGPDENNLAPSWISSEAHSGFLRAEAEMDIGYCADAQREQAAHYAEFLTCADKNRCGQETLLLSLRAKYGWAPFQSFYSAIQKNELPFRGLSEAEKASLVVRFFSEQVGENLVPFFDGLGIVATAADRAAVGELPIGSVPIVSQFSCRPPTLRQTPDVLNATIIEGQAVGVDVVEFVCAPGAWSASLAGTSTGVTIVSSTDKDCGTVRLRVSPEVPAGAAGTLRLASEAAANGFVEVPLWVNRKPNLIVNGGFEGAFEDVWSRVAFRPTSTFSADGTTRHGGQASAKIVSPTDNDSRWVQTVPVRPHTRYELAGYVKTANVTNGAGANLAIERPGYYDHTRGVAGTQDWQAVSQVFDSANETTVSIHARLGGYGSMSAGTAWFDDVRVVEVGPSAP